MGFCNWLDKKAIDPNGSNQKPLVVQSITSYVSDDIQTELDLYTKTMTKLIKSSQKGESFTKSNKTPSLSQFYYIYLFIDSRKFNYS